MGIHSRDTIQDLFPIKTASPQETERAGARLAKLLGAGDIVALFGALGTGKTQLVKGICAELGVPKHMVNSPTFTIVNEYDGSDFPIYHFDAYRIKRPSEFFELGYEEYFFGHGLCIIEWSEYVCNLLPDYSVRLRLIHLGENSRRIELYDPQNK